MNWPLAQKQLSLEQFAKALLDTKDLDPVYFGLQIFKGSHQLKRWLVAYWCFYHCGLASYASEFSSHEFWDVLHKAAANKTPNPTGGRWPRSAERRHFRGEAAVTCISRLRLQYGAKPEAMVDYVSKGKTLEGVTKLVKEHHLFGDWIAFKVADMLERVLQVPVEFGAEVLMYKEPMEGALRGYQEAHPGSSPESLAWAVKTISTELKRKLRGYKAPPNYDRPLGIQELETIYCKFKSHQNGHYPIGKDIREIHHGLHDWEAVSEAAIKFRRALPTLESLL